MEPRGSASLESWDSAAEEPWHSATVEPWDSAAMEKRDFVVPSLEPTPHVTPPLCSDINNLAAAPAIYQYGFYIGWLGHVPGLQGVLVRTGPFFKGANFVFDASCCVPDATTVMGELQLDGEDGPSIDGDGPDRSIEGDSRPAHLVLYLRAHCRASQQALKFHGEDLEEDIQDPSHLAHQQNSSAWLHPRSPSSTKWPHLWSST